ncbi:MAG TPA: RNA polymerase sigma factor [Pirellulaceae bacterium]
MASLNVTAIDDAPTACGVAELAEAFQRNRGWLRSVVLARLGEPQAADDVLQEVALAVVANRAPLAESRKLAPWMYQIAVRQTLLYRRKVGRRRKLLDRYAARHEPRESDGREPDPLDWLLAGERAVHIRRGLEQIAGRDREILMLKYGHDWSYKQIAEHLSISESAVEARLHRARQRLRGILVELKVVEA